MTARILTCFVLAIPRIAQAETLNWQDFVREASAGNARLAAARESVESAKDRERAVYGGYLPQVSANLGAERSSGGLGTATNSYNTTLDVRENLFSGFLTTGQLAERKANRELSEATLDLTAAQVSYSLKQAFSGLAYAQEAVKLNEDIVSRRTDNLKLVELRFEGGRENRGSYLLSKATLTQAKYDLLQSEQNTAIARQQAAQVLGRDSSVDTLAVSTGLPIHDPEPEARFETIVQQTPEYRQQVARVQVADAQVAESRSAFFPTLDAFGTLGRQDTRFFPQEDRWSVGLTLSLPLFRGGTDYYGLKAAANDAKSAVLTQSETTRSLIVSLKQAYSAYVLAVAKLKADTEYAEAATVRAEIARNKYNNGLLTFEDWDIIENDLINRQRTRLLSARDRVVAEAAWEQAQGKGVLR